MHQVLAELNLAKLPVKIMGTVPFVTISM